MIVYLDDLTRYLTDFLRGSNISPNDDKCMETSNELKSYLARRFRDEFGIGGFKFSSPIVEGNDRDDVAALHINGAEYGYHFVVCFGDEPDKVILDPYLPLNLSKALPEFEYLGYAYKNPEELRLR